MFSANTLSTIVLSVPAILVAIVFHEYAHGAAAYLLGDPTAKQQGRLTLNPLKHLDPIGTLMLFIARFGWGKPVPVVHGNLRNPRWGSVVVSAAGPATNFLLATVTGMAIKFGLLPAAFLNQQISLGSASFFVGEFFLYMILYNVILGVFNLLPIPPLDGSHIVAAVLPASLRKSYQSIGAFGIIILLAAIWFMPGGFSFIYQPVIEQFRLWFLV